MTAYLGFFVCALLIFFAGRKLSFYGDLIAVRTGLGKAWIGLILMASVTSLPELMVGISSSAIVQSADLAVGDVLGSCAFNLGILAMMDAFVPKNKTLFGLASQSHVLSAALGILLISLAGAGLFLPNEWTIIPGIGMISVVAIVVYLFSIRLIYTFEQMKGTTPAAEHQLEQSGPSLRTAVLYYSLFALLIIGAALFLPQFAEHIAEDTGLGKTFVGTLLLAASTSMPEIAVSLAAVRMGSIDLAIGNLLGSNIFNIFILALDDIFYTKGPILKHASDNHLLSVLSVIVMTAIAVIGLMFHSERKRYWLATDAVLIFVIYIMNLLLLYKLG